MIYDCIMYSGEKSNLEKHLNTFDKIVDRFIISECNRTVQNVLKPFYFAEHKKYFNSFIDKITYNKYIDRVGTKWNTNDRKIAHSNAVSHALVGCTDDDLILFSDINKSQDAINFSPITYKFFLTLI